MSTPDRLTDEERATARLDEYLSTWRHFRDGRSVSSHGGKDLFLRDLRILAARLAAQPPATDRDALDGEVWVAFDNEHFRGVAPTREAAINELDEWLARIGCEPQPGDEGQWYEPQLPEYRDESRWVRWYHDPAIVRGTPMRSQEVRRAVLAARPAPGTLADRVQAQAKADALRSQRDFFLSVDMPAAADHCEEAAVEWESARDDADRALLAGRSDASPEGGA